MRAVKLAAVVLGAVLLVACADPPQPTPGDKIPAGTAGLPITFIGKVSNESVYTTCYQGDRLYFWDTYSDGAMTIHANDPTCAA